MSALTTVTRAITAENQFSNVLRVANRKFNLSVYSTAISATITLQRKPPEGGADTWRDVATYTADAERIVESVGSWDWRIGCKTGEFSSATALNVELAF